MIRLSRREVLAAGAIALVAGPARAHNGVHHVKIEKLAFVPAQVEARPGETIEWTNADPFDHTATVKGGWEVIVKRGAKATHLVAATDTVDYYCRFHPNMKGRIIVKTD